MKRLILLAFLFATSQAWAAFQYVTPITVRTSSVATHSDWGTAWICLGFCLFVAFLAVLMRVIGRKGLAAFLVCLALSSNTLFGAFGYYSPISINSAQVPSTQTDFPVLVSVTDARFKTVGNGGHVQNSSGFDIRPYTNSGLGTAITGYELERYNASTGEIVMWVKVASLSSSTTPIYLAYGDSGISTDASSATTWSNHFTLVYHLKDGTTLSVLDATGNHNGTNNGATAAAGKIDGGAGFASASSQYINVGNFSGAVSLTLSAWVNGTSFPNSYNSVVLRNFGNTNFFGFLVKSTGKLAWLVNNAGVTQDGTGSHTLSTSTAYYLTMAYDSTNGLVGYVNAASDATHAANGALVTSNEQMDIGRDNVNAGRFWNGTIDEVRMADIARSADWITTEYNNQSAPGTFETLGTEVSLTTTNNGWFFFFP